MLCPVAPRCGQRAWPGRRLGGQGWGSTAFCSPRDLNSPPKSKTKIKNQKADPPVGSEKGEEAWDPGGDEAPSQAWEQRVPQGTAPRGPRAGPVGSKPVGIPGPADRLGGQAGLIPPWACCPRAPRWAWCLDDAGLTGGTGCGGSCDRDPSLVLVHRGAALASPGIAAQHSPSGPASPGTAR